MDKASLSLSRCSLEAFLAHFCWSFLLLIHSLCYILPDFLTLPHSVLGRSRVLVPFVVFSTQSSKLSRKAALVPS
jgi:hypothetical protein